MAAHADGEQAYATLLLTDSYLPGALVLAHSLRDAGTSRKLVVFFTLDSVSADSITRLRAVFDHVIPVPRIRNEHRENLYLMNRPDLDSAFTKISLWKQTQFSKIVYLDADVVAYRAPDELFALQQPFSAAPDIGWPDLFNTGVMAMTPNLGDYYALLAMAERGISFDGADQGLLNMYFKNTVHRLSFTYNVTLSAHYQYLPAYRHFQSSISMVHFIGPNKPWFEGRHALHGASPYGEMIGRWWSVYDRHYHIQHGSSDSQSRSEGVQSQIQARHPDAQQPQPLPHQNIKQPSPVLPQIQGQPHNHSQFPTLQSTKFQDPLTEPQVSRHAGQEQKEIKTYIHSQDQSWDAQRQPPPRDSKPEAENFPKTHYVMSQDVKPFVPPARYPSPPKDMWYEVPKQRPTPLAQPPKAIFPWEGQQPQASRAFPDVPDELPLPVSAKEKEVQAEPPCNTASGAGTIQAKTSATIPTSAPSVWSSFTLVNAWDDVPEISRYIERSRGHSRGKSSQISLPASKSGDVPQSPPQKRLDFRGLKLTDFPTEVERPSLPVTPAPVRRPSFWGGDDGEDAASKDLAKTVPAADGVPAQSEWNPTEQLQKLAAQHSEELLRRLSGADGESLGMVSESSPHTPEMAIPTTTSSFGVLGPTPVAVDTPRVPQQAPQQPPAAAAE
ncbi:glycogenin [Cordyceps javanica]|uniref:glycogenin glucosyltransferase n=1 Tax=Cordyceps javanica TaxID=43265 RepID=A0A545VBU8_9HYPO|nr:glycogenin [Cordyceps javanica]TQW11156.1 glycogenin [Cordyceps javanica]